MRIAVCDDTSEYREYIYQLINKYSEDYTIDVDLFDCGESLLESVKTTGPYDIIASHNSDDIDILCDKVYHMSEGRITC